MPQPLRRTLAVWGLVIFGTLAAFAVRLSLGPTLGYAAPFVFFIFVATVCAWFGGALAGMAATVLGLLLGNYFFTPPRHSLIVENPIEWVQSLTFIAEGALLSVLCEVRLQAKARQQRYLQRLRDLASELTLTEQRQRRELAQGLHDHLQQLLVAAKLHAELLTRDATDPQRKPLRTTTELLDQAIAYTRDLTTELSPPILYTEGLAAALRALGAEFKRRYRLDVDVEGIHNEPRPLPEDARVLLYQAVRELLFNTVKHAATDRAAIRMTAEAGLLRVAVEDAGRGYDPAAAQPRRGGLGLFSVRERIENLGGRFEIDAAPGRGARMRLTLPLP